MNTIEEIEQQIIEEFSNFDEWMDKYAYIIELGNDCPMIDEKDKVEKNLIKADSDAVITKGIIALLLRVFNHQKPEDVYKADLKFIDVIGLSSHLSPSRSNGLLSMIKQIKLYAFAFSIKQNQ